MSARRQLNITSIMRSTSGAGRLDLALAWCAWRARTGRWPADLPPIEETSPPVDDSGTPEAPSPEFSGLLAEWCRSKTDKRQYQEHGVVSLVRENTGFEK